MSRSRVTRTALVAQLHSEHVDTARVRGIPRTRIFAVHVFRNAAPQILAISGTTIAGLFAASAIAKVAFGIGGVGALLVAAAGADLVNALIDPSSIAGGRRL